MSGVHVRCTLSWSFIQLCITHTRTHTPARTRTRSQAQASTEVRSVKKRDSDRWLVGGSSIHLWLDLSEKPWTIVHWARSRWIAVRRGSMTFITEIMNAGRKKNNVIFYHKLFESWTETWMNELVVWGFFYCHVWLQWCKNESLIGVTSCPLKSPSTVMNKILI